MHHSNVSCYFLWCSTDIVFADILCFQEVMKCDAIDRCQIVVAGHMSWSRRLLRCHHFRIVNSSSRCSSEIEEVSDSFHRLHEV